MTMKKNLYIILLVLGAMLSACSENAVEGVGGNKLQVSIADNFLNVSPRNITLHGQEGQSAILTISAGESVNWVIDNPSFNMVAIGKKQGTGGANVEISMRQSNTDTTEKVYVITVRNGNTGREFPVTIHQRSKAEYISLTCDEKTMPLSGVSHTLLYRVNTSQPWMVEKNYLPWITIEEDHANNTFTVLVKENATAYTRGATLKVSTTDEDKQTAEASIYQSSATITGSADIVIDNENQAQVMFESETSWKATTNDAWLSVSASDGLAGKNTITILAEDNNTIYDLQGSVLIQTYSPNQTERGNSIMIKVVKKGKYISGPEVLEIDANEPHIISIESNTDWKIISLPDWLVADKVSGSGKSEVTFTAQRNYSTGERNGSVIIGHETLTLTHEIKVTQAGLYFNNESESFTVGDTASVVTVKIDTNGEWYTFPSEDWIKVNPDRGIGKQDIEISIAENHSDDERNGFVLIVSGEFAPSVFFLQYGKYIGLSESAFAFSALGESMVLYVTTNTQWKSSIQYSGAQQDWLVAECSADMQSITIKAEPNNTKDERKATLLLTRHDGQNYKVDIVQKGRELSVDKGSLIFPFDPMEQTIRVSADGPFTATASDDWMTINASQSVLTVNVSQNTADTQRIGHITIALDETDLSIDVTIKQNGAKTMIEIEGFGPENDWSESNMNNDTNSMGITIKGYTTEVNYDSAKSANE